MQESTLTGLPGTTLLSIAAFALIATAIFAFAASFAFRQVHNASLEPPDHQLKPPPELLAKAQPLTDTDLLPLLSMTTHVPRNDRSSFHQHLWNKAVANGWYTYRHRASTYIIMPSDHAPALEDLAADPVPWATGNPPPITKSQAPLVKTKLSFSPERYYPTHLLGDRRHLRRGLLLHIVPLRRHQPHRTHHPATPEAPGQPRPTLTTHRTGATDMSAPHSPSMAQQACRIYDKDGETAMLSFLLENEQPPPTDNIPPTSFILPDGSRVQCLTSRYCFISADTSFAKERPSRTSLQTNPALLRRHQAILPWPDATSIMRAITQEAALKAQQVLGIEPDTDLNPLTLLDVIASAPGFQPALQTALRRMSQAPLPGRRIYDYLDQAVEDHAKATIEAMPQEDFDHLVEIAKARITSED